MSLKSPTTLTVLFFVLCAVMGRVDAATVSTVSLPGLVENADRIFYGVCLSVDEGVEPSLSLPVSVYRFRVVEALKGVQEGEIVVFRQLDSSRGIRVAGLPSYTKGQRILLFLHGNSRLGLTSPVGMLQGIFRPARNSRGELAFSNAVENANLAHDLDSAQALAAGLSQEDVERLRAAEPLSLSDLRYYVDKLNGRSNNPEKAPQ